MTPYRDPHSRNRVIPQLEPLEDRVLPWVFGLPAPEPPPLFFPAGPLRTGGTAVQTGSVLNIGVAPTALNGPLSAIRRPDSRWKGQPHDGA